VHHAYGLGARLEVVQYTWHQAPPLKRGARFSKKAW